MQWLSAIRTQETVVSGGCCDGGRDVRDRRHGRRRVQLLGLRYGRWAQVTEFLFGFGFPESSNDTYSVPPLDAEETLAGASEFALPNASPIGVRTILPAGIDIVDAHFDLVADVKNVSTRSTRLPHPRHCHDRPPMVARLPNTSPCRTHLEPHTAELRTTKARLSLYQVRCIRNTCRGRDGLFTSRSWVAGKRVDRVEDVLTSATNRSARRRCHPAARSFSRRSVKRLAVEFRGSGQCFFCVECGTEYVSFEDSWEAEAEKNSVTWAPAAVPKAQAVTAAATVAAIGRRGPRRKQPP